MSASTDVDSTVEQLTVDELAARTGMTVRTIRFYAAEGLLPPPTKRGRVAYYGEQHRMRLQLIRELQEHGFTLAAIERVLGRIPHDASAAEFAMQAALLAPWTPERSEELDHPAIDRRAGRRLSSDELDLLVSLGALETAGPLTYRSTPSLLAMGLGMLELPVPLAFMREAAEVIDEHATAVAEGLADVFRRHIWEPFRRGEASPADQEQLAAIVARLRPLAVQGLVGAFGRAAERAVRRPLAD